MRFKFLLLNIFLFAFVSGVFAKKINRNTAEKVAVNFFYEKFVRFNHPIDYTDLNVSEIKLVDNTYWIVNFTDGWVLVSADDIMTPVIGYNFEGNFPAKEKQENNLKSWMQYFTDQVNYIEENQITQSEGIEAEWNKYSTTLSELTIRSGERGSVDPLLSCKWNQDSPYNVLCPEDDNGPGDHVYVGCVATAMVQIMYYWRYPNSGTGSHSYYWDPYGTITANFGDATYEWDAMQDKIVHSNPWEIAEIGFHAAVSIDMMFSPNGSGAFSWDVPYALKNYFNYANNVQYVEKSNYNFSTWETMIQTELDDGHPLYYSGFSNEGGHAFVFDGYQGSNFYHINLGWGGSSNGYYTLQDVAGFSSGQAMVRYIIPDDPNYPYFADGEYTLTHFSGSFTDGSGPVEDYPSGTSASWLIDPQNEIDSVSKIILEFKEFKTSSSDIVKVYGGNSTDDELLGEFSGSDLPEVISFDGNQMLVTFNSTGSNEGFRAEYYTSLPTWCEGEILTEPSGSFSDGSGSFYYNNGTTCVYIIQNPEAVKITLEFTEFDTEEGKDKIQVYNEYNQLLAEFSGDDIPPVITEETGTMIVVWVTNSSVRGPGWSAEYMIDGVGINENDPQISLLIFPNPTNNLINLEMKIDKTTDLKIRLTNMSGQTIFSEAKDNFTGSYKNNIELSNHSKGIYLLSVITDNGKYDRKVILK